MNVGSFFEGLFPRFGNVAEFVDTLMQQCWRVERLACHQDNKGMHYAPEIRSIAKADNLQTLEILVDAIDKDFESASCTISMAIAVSQCGCVFGSLWENTHQKICEVHTLLLGTKDSDEQIKALYEDALTNKIPDVVPDDWVVARDQRQADKDAKSLLKFMDEDTA